MKRNTLSVWSLIMAAVLLAGLLCLPTSCKKEQEKELTVTEYLDAVMEKTADTRISGPVGQAREKLDLGAVRFDLSFKSSETLQKLAGTELPEISFTGVRKGEVSRASVTLTMSGQTFDGTLTQSGTEIAVESGLLDKVYGTDLAKWKENYQNSVFADKDGKYYADLGSDAEEAFGSLAVLSDLPDRLKPYFDTVRDTLETEHTTMVKLEEGGREISVTLNKEGAKEIVKKLFAMAKEDADLRALLDEILGAASLDAAEKLDRYFEAEDTGKKVDEFFENHISAFDWSEVIVTDANDLLKTAKITLECADKDGNVRKATILCDLSDGSKSVISIALDGDWGEDISFKKASLIHCVTENTETSYKSYVSIAAESDKMNVELRLFDFGYDLATHVYTASLSIPDSDTYTVKGELFIEEKSLELTVTSLESDTIKQYAALLGGDGAITFDLRVKVSETDEAPTMPEYTEIFSLTEEDLDKIAEKIRSLGSLPTGRKL